MKLGAQVYSVRKYIQTMEDYGHTLKKLKALGYDTVQHAGVDIADPYLLRDLTQEAGLQQVCPNINPAPLLEDADKVIECVRVLGCNSIMLPYVACDSMVTLESFLAGWAPLEAPLQKLQEAYNQALAVYKMYSSEDPAQLKLQAEKYNFDTERIAVWGPSSGGWLSSYVAVTNGNPAFEDLSMGNGEYSSRIDACVDWCGPCAGFLAMDEALKASGKGVPDHSEDMSPESQFLGAPITRVPELVRLASPIAHVSADTVPFLIIHGGADAVVPTEQSVAFYEALKEAGANARLHIAEGKPHHGDPWYHEKWVSDMCLDFLDEVLERK